LKYLIDTSALYPLILMLRDRVLLYIDILFVSDLTRYEVGNVLWKEYGRVGLKVWRQLSHYSRKSWIR